MATPRRKEPLIPVARDDALAIARQFVGKVLGVAGADDLGARVVAEAPGRKADRCHVRLQMKLNINRATESNVSRTLGRVEREAVAHALALGALAC